MGGLFTGSRCESEPGFFTRAGFLVVRLVLHRQSINTGVFVVSDPPLGGGFERGVNLVPQATYGLSELLAAQTGPALAQGNFNIARFGECGGQPDVIAAPVMVNTSSAPVLKSAYSVVRIFTGNLDLNGDFHPGDFDHSG